MLRCTSPQPRSRWARGQRGQTIMIMAFLILFMILLMGLVIDSVRLFTLAAQAERAAEAGSLAGALYMPTYYSTASPDGEYAINRVCEAVKQNGITACPVSLGQIGATPAKVTGNPYEVEVTVTLQTNVFFLSYIAPGLGSATVSRSALAQYLPPIELGSRTAYFGDQSPQDKVNGNFLQNFWAFINGPLELKEHGDAYTPTYEEGPTDPQAYPDASSFIYSYNRWSPAIANTTNHQQWPAGPKTPNPDQHPAGFTGAKGTLGYNYQIVIPQGTPPLELWVFNPAFDPRDSNITLPPLYPPPTTDGLDSACFDPKFGSGGACTTTDDPTEYLQMTYSLYQISLPFERSFDTKLTSHSYPSLDLYRSDLTKHGCATAYDPVAKSCAAPGYIDGWEVLHDASGLNPLMLSPGTYRLVVEATGYYGRHGYGLKLTDATGKLAPSGVGLWAWNDMCVHFNATGTTSIFDLGEIPAAYASKTLNFSLFDPGDSGGNVTIQILDPSGNPVQFPSWVRTVSGSNGTKLAASINGDELYNGQWLHLPIPIPSNYNPAPGSDWWQIKYTTSGTPADTITISISLTGSPIHLVQLLS